MAKVDDQLMGQANGDWVQWYIAFAESPLVIGYNPSSRFVDDLKNKSWYEVLAEPGLKLGRTGQATGMAENVPDGDGPDRRL